MRRALLCLLLPLIGLVALPARAQDAQDTVPATLTADRVSVDGNARLVADGNVEMLIEGNRLRASRVTYDRQTDRLTIEGPMTLVTDTGTILLADSADLAPDLADGILLSARMVLNQQLQLAAAAIQRVGGRYTVLDKTVASSCQICITHPVPLWQIRARRIVHDEDAQQLYFDHARFELIGVPIMYLPRLRLPDPTLERAAGFLIPKVRATDGLGTGVKVPYFLPLGEHADVTVTPYVSTGRTRTLELRYRQAFRSGTLQFDAGVSRDDLRAGKTRAYLFGEGTFALPQDFTLSFNIETASDKAYLLDYGYSDKDRLKSSVLVGRTRRDEQIEAGLYTFKTLRTSEDNDTLPTTVLGVSYQRRFEPAVIGGIARLDFESFAHHRQSGADIIGRDVARATARADWRRGWVTRNGIIITALGELDLDYYAIADDSSYAASVTQATPFTAVELRWPFVKAGASGATHVLEPVVQLVWSRKDGDPVPNEDSVSVEFDEGNLFSLSRFPGADARERGLRANIGVGWTRHDPAGWSLGVTAGRILHQEDLNQFASGTGLNDRTSDWLAAIRLKTAGNLSLTNRSVFDDTFSFTRDELRLLWANDDLAMASSYVWQEANIAENRASDSSEWVFDAAYRFHPNWTGKADWRYDFVTERAARAGVGLIYRNECVTVDLSLSRRFTSSTSVRPTTDFGLSVSLNGFGAGGDGRSYRRTCAR